MFTEKKVSEYDHILSPKKGSPTMNLAQSRKTSQYFKSHVQKGYQSTRASEKSEKQ